MILKILKSIIGGGGDYKAFVAQQKIILKSIIG